ncbi:TolC family protein [Flavicella sediminum]|uniref:TolC family protein n=1 Tax=Flavicella sediminum TaxID=2585141 RepID=UPI00111DD498|nr:TolC family protein [Flavicella sediminum]
MKNIKRNLFIAGVLLCVLQAESQEILSKEKAIEIALENNFDVLMIQKNLEAAKNNTSVLNGGYLPTLSTTASARHFISTGKAETQDGKVNTVEDAQSDKYSASIGLGYNNFNIYGQIYSLKKVREQYNLTELQVKSVMENTIQTLFSAYYEVARLTEDLQIKEENLEASKERLKRVEVNFDYGQSSKLAVLNAKVDLKNDEVAFLESERTLDNAKRDLNIVLGRAITTPVNVRSEVDYIFGLNKEELLEKSKQNNTALLQEKKNLELSQYDVKINRSGWMPNVSLTSSYAWNRNINDATSFQVYNQGRGINYGVGLSWNIFDGGVSINNTRNAKIALDVQEIEIAKLGTSLEKDVRNAWKVYENLLAVLELQKMGVEVNTLNFQQSEEMYKLGQISSVDFRQAQINLMNAKLQLNTTKFDTKNSELALLRLAGELLENDKF